MTRAGDPPPVRYLVYDQDGAGLVYSGTDEAAYAAARAELAQSHATARRRTSTSSSAAGRAGCWGSPGSRRIARAVEQPGRVRRPHQ
jgi:hypothetical protein